MKNKKQFYKIIYKKLINILVSIIIFLTPTNFFLKFFESESYVNGLRVDYLIPKLYLSDVFILILLFFWVTNKKSKLRINKKKIKKFLKGKCLIIVLILIFVLRQLFTSYPISSVMYLLRIMELGFLVKFLSKNKKKINKSWIKNSVLITLLFQSSVAIYQYIYQKSLFGYLLLGEPNLSNYIGVTKNNLFGAEKILPYGTTAHPNVLGGFLAIYLIYIFNKVGWKLENFAKIMIIFLSILVLFLTQSVSAIIAFLLGLSLIIYQKYSKKTKKILRKKLTLKNIAFLILALIITTISLLNILARKYPNNQSISRRNYLNVAALNMTRSNILVGVGLNNFTSEVENFSDNKEVVRFVQPAHNIFLLFFAETGLLGIAILGAIAVKASDRNQPKIFQLKNIFKKKQKNWWWIIVLLPIALLDHYLLTLNTGMLLFVLTIL
jgi:O-antigen ligase